MSFTIAIIGRPNVGKSTLFNRLTGLKHAIVDDIPGVTRDRREGIGKIGDLTFRLIDTAGLEEVEKNSLEARMMKQTQLAIEEANICYLVVDGRVGITNADEYFANWLRTKNKPVILVVNKCEGSKGDSGINESYRLGFENIAAISAEHNEGMGDLYDTTSQFYQITEEQITQDNLEDNVLSEEKEDKHIQIAIIGRPNTGKSTLINQLLKTERVLTGPEAGITRDSIAIDTEFNGNKIRLIDTAGIRRKANITGKLERLSVNDTLRALNFAHVAAIMLDVTQPFEQQDLHIIELAIKEGRAIVIVVNKWDLIAKNDREKTIVALQEKADKLLPQIKHVPLITVSALKNFNIDKIMEACLAAYKMWNVRITTAHLNTWLKHAEGSHLPPLGKNKRRIRLKYITQIKRRPPSFNLFVNLPDDLPQSYTRYLVNSLREEFKIFGVPIRLNLKKVKNPYEKS